MASDTGIANRALRLLKANRITSLTDGTNNANALNDVFTEVRDELLRGHDWNFATKRQKLARSGTAPVSEFDYAYPFPSDWIRTIGVYDNDACVGTFFYQEEEINGQGAIASSVEDVWLTYVYKVTDANRMPPDFRAAFSYFLALAAPGVSNISSARESELLKEAKSLLRKAKHSDALGSAPERRPAGSWVTVRGGYPNWRAWPD